MKLHIPYGSAVLQYKGEIELESFYMIPQSPDCNNGDIFIVSRQVANTVINSNLGFVEISAQQTIEAIGGDIVSSESEDLQELDS